MGRIKQENNTLHSVYVLYYKFSLVREIVSAIQITPFFDEKIN